MTKVDFIHYFEKFTFPPPVTLHVKKRQELYMHTKCSVQTKQIQRLYGRKVTTGIRCSMKWSPETNITS